jgi:hypothetical protein
MSYSIGPIRAATVAALIAAMSVEFDRAVLPSQPVHGHDKLAHLENLRSQAGLVTPPGPDQEYAASMNGYLSWNQPIPAGHVLPPAFSGGGFGCSVNVVAKEAQKA